MEGIEKPFAEGEEKPFVEGIEKPFVEDIEKPLFGEGEEISFVEGIETLYYRGWRRASDEGRVPVVGIVQLVQILVQVVTRRADPCPGGQPT